jgi:hypothetical protein
MPGHARAMAPGRGFPRDKSEFQAVPDSDSVEWTRARDWRAVSGVPYDFSISDVGAGQDEDVR